jgi:periplasmic protein TonB
VQESVSDILVDRARVADGLSRMVIVSLTAHALLIAVLVVTPAKWRVATIPPTATPMTIVLGGGSGPDTGGMTPISGRPVQVEAPAETKPAPVAPPAPKVPEMVEPAAKPAPKTPAKPLNKPVDKSAAKKPNSGPEIKEGDAPRETGGEPVKFGGLTRPAGSDSANSGAYTDYANFCCPMYLKQMTDLIRRNWNNNQGTTGEVLLKFTIQRDGTLANVQVEKSSGNALLDLESQRAIAKTRALPALPREFTESTLTVHLTFDYHR